MAKRYTEKEVQEREMRAYIDGQLRLPRGTTRLEDLQNNAENALVGLRAMYQNACHQRDSLIALINTHYIGAVEESSQYKEVAWRADIDEIRRTFEEFGQPHAVQWIIEAADALEENMTARYREMLQNSPSELDSADKLYLAGRIYALNGHRRAVTLLLLTMLTKADIPAVLCDEICRLLRTQPPAMERERHELWAVKIRGKIEPRLERLSGWLAMKRKTDNNQNNQVIPKSLQRMSERLIRAVDVRQSGFSIEEYHKDRGFRSVDISVQEIRRSVWFYELLEEEARRKSWTQEMIDARARDLEKRSKE